MLARLPVALFAVLLLSCTVRPLPNGDDEFEGDDEGECGDGTDNDRDGFFDCDDQDCFGAPECQGDDDDSAADDDDSTPADDDSTPADDDDTPSDDDDSTPSDDDDSTPSDDDDATTDDDDATADDDDSFTPGVCEPFATLQCGDVLTNDTSGPDATDAIDGYNCTTWNESGPEVTWSITPTTDTLLSLYLVAFGPHQLDLFVLEDTGSGCFEDDCIADGNYYIDDVPLSAGTTYYVVVDGFSGWKGPFELTVTCPP